LSKVSSIYLSRKETERLKEVCEKEGCKPYSLVKRVLLDHIWAYPLEKAPPSEKESIKQELGEDVITDAPEPEASEVDAEEVSERVKRILKGNEV